MVSGQSRMSNGAITGFKINNDLTSDFIIHELGYMPITQMMSISSQERLS
ncbi:hypothetical protein BSPWISOXPB_11208 [uncultured Gammaproteobacteria bacterium]|nr:hypothetical protein BSPWISOXPB_11208 [uncultured Gammaproteobacteria bacterium]